MQAIQSSSDQLVHLLPTDDQALRSLSKSTAEASQPSLQGLTKLYLQKKIGQDLSEGNLTAEVLAVLRSRGWSSSDLQELVVVHKTALFQWDRRDTPPRYALLERLMEQAIDRSDLFILKHLPIYFLKNFDRKKLTDTIAICEAIQTMIAIGNDSDSDSEEEVDLHGFLENAIHKQKLKLADQIDRGELSDELCEELLRNGWSSDEIRGLKADKTKPLGKNLLEQAFQKLKIEILELLPVRYLVKINDPVQKLQQQQKRMLQALGDLQRIVSLNAAIEPHLGMDITSIITSYDVPQA